MGTGNKNRGRRTRRPSHSPKQEARSRSRRKPQRNLSPANLPKRSQSAYDRALHAIAAMRREPNLRLSQATKLHGVKADTIRKYFPSELTKSRGRFRVRKSDRYSATVYLPDKYGNSIAVPTRSFKERQRASEYLRDLGRYLRGNRDAMSRWHGKKIAGFELVTAGRTIANIEPALSDFSLYRTFSGGAE